MGAAAPLRVWMMNEQGLNDWGCCFCMIYKDTPTYWKSRLCLSEWVQTNAVGTELNHGAANVTTWIQQPRNALYRRFHEGALQSREPSLFFSWDTSWRFLFFVVIFPTWQHLSLLVHVTCSTLNLFGSHNSSFSFCFFFFLLFAFSVNSGGGSHVRLADRHGWLLPGKPN